MHETPWPRRSRPSPTPSPDSWPQRRTRSQTPAELGGRKDVTRADAHRSARFGPQPRMTPSYNTTIPPGRGRRPSQLDRDRGVRATKPTMPHFFLKSKVRHPIITLVYPHRHVRSKNMKITPSPNPPSHSTLPSTLHPQSPRTLPTKLHSGGHAGWQIAKHHARCDQNRTCSPHPQGDTSLATTTTYFGVASRTAPFHQQWWTVAALRGWVRPRTRADARAVSPTKSSYSPEAR